MAEKIVKYYEACNDVAAALGMYLRLQASRDPKLALQMHGDIIEIQTSLKNQTAKDKSFLKDLVNSLRGYTLTDSE